MTKTLSITINDNIYEDLKSKVGVGKISSFVNKTVKKELEELAQAEKMKKEDLEKKLMLAFQRQAKNKELQKELTSLERVTIKDLSKKR